jgi:hypothetical protein
MAPAANHAVDVPLVPKIPKSLPSFDRWVQHSTSRADSHLLVGCCQLLLKRCCCCHCIDSICLGLGRLAPGLQSAMKINTEPKERFAMIHQLSDRSSASAPSLPHMS